MRNGAYAMRLKRIATDRKIFGAGQFRSSARMALCAWSGGPKDLHHRRGEIFYKKGSEAA
jgi:hypothetical protein